VAVFSEACTDLARLIETDASEAALRAAVAGHVAALSRRIGRAPDRAILGCTHYEIIADLFRAALPPGTPLIHQPAATADAITLYLARHPEFRAGDGGQRRFLTTGKPGPQNGLVERFWGEALTFDPA
jgi:glutamate racemase